jgi:type IV secretory pathway VirB10-like protein
MNRLITNLALTGLALILCACETAKQPGDEATSSTQTTQKQDKAPSAVPKADPMVSNPAPVTPPVAKAAEALPVVKPEQLYAEGKDLYDKGDYKNAIRKLSMARDASEDTPSIRQNSLKLLAFSYCVTSQRPQCKAQFTSLLKLAPSFQLSRGEAGHPLWGPAFKEVKDLRVEAKADSKVAIQAKPTK